jgi:two-component system, NtrC family, response regulator HupR/HoxA
MKDITAADSVLFVDDEENILHSIERGLNNEPFLKYFASSGLQALDILSARPVSVIVTDMRMPEMDGLELLKIVQEKYPLVVRIILTGYAHIFTIIPAINTGQVFRYLTKPWKIETEFIPALHQSIRHHQILLERSELIGRLTEQNEQLNSQNQEIRQLMKRLDEASRSKTKIVTHLTKHVVPYVTDVIQTMIDLRAGDGRGIPEIAADLSARGTTILELLHKVEDLLKEELAE